MKLQEAEQFWLDQTTEEEIRFGLFAEPCRLRRPKTGMKALASLIFGHYKDLSDQPINDDNVIWLGMIMSEKPGEGARLLGQICQLAWTCGLAICGDPVPLKPESWDPQRRWSGDRNDLIAWYLRNEFRIVQTKRQTRLWYLPPGIELAVQTELVGNRSPLAKV
jgi:hypothetical protein